MELKTGGKLTWATFSPDGTLIAASYNDTTAVRLWGAASGPAKWSWEVQRKGDAVEDFGPDARSLAVLNEDRAVGV